MKKLLLFGSSLAVLLHFPCAAQVVINEFQYDDTGTDDREFVELYNAGDSSVNIGGWVLGGYDPTTTNPSATIPTDTMIGAKGFYVIANTGTLNVNQTVASSFLENDQEVITLKDASATLMDAVAYETNRGIVFVAAAELAQIGPGLFGNHQGGDIAGTPLNATVSWGRFVDGRDTNNNGRDFGVRPATPGTTNAPLGNMTVMTLPDPGPLTNGSATSLMTGTFVPPRVIDPAIFDTNNPNVIDPPLGTGSKAYTMWDPAGGGNGATSLAAFASPASEFSIRAYLDTRDLPIQSNASAVQFRGSEITIYGIGSGDALTNLTDLDGSVGLAAVVLPAAESANGFTGIAWVYEKVGYAPPAGTVASEKLYLVNANDGGDSDLGGNTPLDWQILASYDLSSTNSGWAKLSIQMDAAGNGIARFNGQATAFVATGFNSGAFNIGYRENLQLFTDGTPDALLRPATFIFEPTLSPIAFSASPPGTRVLTIPALGAATIGVEYSDSLTNWMDVGNFTFSNGIGTWEDTDAVRLGRTRGFYRPLLR